MKIIVVIPLFNEEKHAVNVLKGLAKYNLQVVVVDDGSTDNSKSRIQNTKLNGVKLLEHQVNLGKGAAMKTGADWSFDHGADAVVFFDSDDQHQQKDLAKFIEVLQTNKYDVVFGSRNFSYGVPLVRFLGNKIASVMIAALFNIYISDVICGFRAVTKKAYGKIRWESEGYGVETEMVVRVGKNKLKFCEIPVETVYHDSVKGVTVLDAFGIFFSVLKWKLSK